MAALSATAPTWQSRVAALNADTASQRGPDILDAITRAFSARSSSVSTAVLQSRVQWATETPYLRCVTCDVPAGILPSGLSGKLHEIKVNPRGYGKKKGPPTDDACYEQEEKVRRLVPRGLCFIEVFDGGTPLLQGPACFAMRKFSGGLGDEDNEDGKGTAERWKCFFPRPANEASVVCASKKANGEAAHFSCVRVPQANGKGSIVLKIAGSKHVHLCYRDAATDLDKYTNEDRFRLAKIVARTFEASPASADPAFLEFLADTGLTCCFELEQPASMHIEMFDFDAPRLAFLAFTPSDIGSVSGDLEMEDGSLSRGAQHGNHSGHCLPPVFGYRVAAMFGLTPVPYTLHEASPSHVSDVIHKVRLRWGDEGDVFYFVDAEGHTIGLVKVKTVWYVVARAIREKLRTMLRNLTKAEKNGAFEEGMTGSDGAGGASGAGGGGGGGAGANNRRKLSKAERRRKNQSRKKSAAKKNPDAMLREGIRKVKTRLAQLQTWLNFDDTNLERWSEMGASFMNFCFARYYAGSLKLEDVSKTFPLLWRKHLESAGMSDRFPVRLRGDDGGGETKTALAADGGAGGDNSSDDEMIASKQLTAADFSESVELHGGRVVHLTMRLGAKNFAPLFSDEWTGSHLWPCSRDLSNLLLRGGYVSEGQKVIELGSGAGLVSIVACMLGATVVATDQDSLVDLIQTNAAHNLVDAVFQSRFEARALDWADVSAAASAKDTAGWDEGFELVLASDCINPVYGEENIPDLANAVAALCVSPTARFVLAYEERGGEEGESDALSLFQLFCQALNGAAAPSRKYGWTQVWSEGDRACYCFQVVAV